MVTTSAIRWDRTKPTTPHDYDLAIGVTPEVGVHGWRNADWRASATLSHTLIDFEGPRSGDYSSVGVSLPYLSSFGEPRPRD